MKKIIVLLLMAVLGMKAQAQLLQGDGFYANKGYEIGLIGGVIGVYDDLSYGAFGLNFTAYGVYVDFLGMPRAHEKSTDVDVHENEKTSIGVHLGYQLPLTTWLSIIPVVGYASVKNGTTDGSNYKINKQTGITNSYKVKDENGGFDYGGLYPHLAGSTPCD
jgi:hypothetical protein